MSPRAIPFGCLLVATLSSAALAQPQSVSTRPAKIRPVTFDLSPVLVAPQSKAEDERLHPLVERKEWLQASDVPNTSWSYRTSSRGPQLEVAALGAGNKDMPSLAHVGLDWSF